MDDTDTLMPGDAISFEQPVTGQSPMPLSDLPAAGPAVDPPGIEIGDQAAARQHRAVPYGALAEERARRKELQRELQGAAEAQKRLQGRLDLLHALAQQHGVPGADGEGEAPPGEASDQPPEMPHEPPLALDMDARAGAAFRTQVMHSVRDIMRERPDFLAAYQHARQARVSELCALGYAPQEALEITFDNEREIIQSAYASGRNPGQVIYDYARRRGYGGSSSAAASRGADTGGGRAGSLSEAEKIALAARGQAGAKSLSMAGGGATGTLTLEALAGMSDEEFAEATKGDRWQKLLRN
jgi:hypothetical protein